MNGHHGRRRPSGGSGLAGCRYIYNHVFSVMLAVCLASPDSTVGGASHSKL